MSEEQQAYTYPDPNKEQDSYSNSAFQGGTETLKSILSNRRVMMLIAFVFLIIFFMVRKNKRAEENELPKAPPIQKVADVLPPPLVHLPPPPPPIVVQAPPQPPQAVVMPVDPKWNESIERLNQEVHLLSSGQEEVQAQQSALSTGLEAMTEGLAQIQKQLDELKHSQLTVPAPAPCTLQAVIEGRAWINEGPHVRTVVVGDVVPGYGYVVDIDPDEGYVATSSGKHIRFVQA